MLLQTDIGLNAKYLLFLSVLFIKLEFSQLIFENTLKYQIS
jgi:hypothetical protein